MSEMSIFQPKREDGRAAWRVVLDYVVERARRGELKIGDVIPHAALLRELEAEQDGSYYQAVAKATEVLQRNYGRTLNSVRGTGYRFAAGMDQLRRAEGFQEKAHRTFGKGLRSVQTIDDSALEIDERRLVDKIRIGFQAIASVLDMQAEKVAEHEAQIEMLKSQRMDDQARTYATEEEIADLKRRLGKLEKGELG